MKNLLRASLLKTTSLVIGFTLVVSVSFALPRTAYAWDITWDLPNSVLQLGTFISQMGNTLLSGEDFTKEYVLDPIAWIVSKNVIQSMTQSMINSVASGNDGAPQYVTDLQKNLQGVGDARANDFIKQLTSDGRIDSPFKTSSINSARDSYYRNTGSGGFGTVHPYTLKETCPNDAAFLSGDFMSCGLSGWFAAIQNPSNTPYGSELVITDALLQGVGTEEETRKEELRWGSGFLSKRDCGAQSESGPEGADADHDSTSANLSQTDPTYKCAIENPGSVLSSLTNEFIFSGTGVPAQTSADELSEVLAGMFSTFLTNFLSDGIGGALGDDGGGGGGSGGSGGGSVGQNILSSFQQTIANQKAHIQPYLDAWKRIQGVAQSARAKLESCDAPKAQTALAEEVMPVLDQSAAEIARGTAALVKLNELQTKAQSNNGSAEEFQKLYDEYQALQAATTTPLAVSSSPNVVCNSGGIRTLIPSVQEIGCVIQQSQDTGGSEPSSVYYRMALISGRSCFFYRGD